LLRIRDNSEVEVVSFGRLSAAVTSKLGSTNLGGAARIMDQPRKSIKENNRAFAMLPFRSERSLPRAATYRPDYPGRGGQIRVRRPWVAANGVNLK